MTATRVASQRIDGACTPGTRLAELTLAEEFGVSQAPVREALRELLASWNGTSPTDAPERPASAEVPVRRGTRPGLGAGPAAVSRRVTVTAAGKRGRAVVADLTANGWDMLSIDRVRSDDVNGEFVAVYLTDHAQVLEVLTGGVDEHAAPLDAVARLTAVPAPGLVTNSATFTNDATVSSNLFAAARAARIRNVVWASSETLLSLSFGTPPPYVPVDEEYRAPRETTYSLVKALEEEMAHHLCRWDPQLRMVALRFSNVMEPGDSERFPDFDADPQLRKWNLWGHIDARDGAQAVRCALDYQATALDAFIIANADTVMSRASKDLVAEVLPGVEVRKKPRGARDAAVNRQGPHGPRGSSHSTPGAASTASAADGGRQQTRTTTTTDDDREKLGLWTT